MKKHLFLHLSFMGLMGLSTIAYGGWTKYGPNFKSGDPIPNGDCLEMMCEHGCVEDENGLNGTCCPNDGTNGSACTIGACCKSGVCEEGYCSETCPLNSSTEVTSWQIGETGCYCETGYIPNEAGTDCVEGCATNDDCGGVGSGYYCKFPVISNSFAVTAPSTTCVQPQNGVCTKIPETRKIENFTTLKSILPDAYMDWYSADSLCQALGLSLVQAHDLCTDEEYETVLHAAGDCGDEAGYRHCTGWEFPKDAGGVNRFWTATPSKYFNCSMWAISLANGDLVPCYNRSSNANLARPLCKGKNSCPSHSSTTVREGAQIGKTGCYCENGYRQQRRNGLCKLFRKN